GETGIFTEANRIHRGRRHARGDRHRPVRGELEPRFVVRADRADRDLLYALGQRSLEAQRAAECRRRDPEVRCVRPNAERTDQGDLATWPALQRVEKLPGVGPEVLLVEPAQSAHSTLQSCPLAVAVS